MRLGWKATKGETKTLNTSHLTTDVGDQQYEDFFFGYSTFPIKSRRHTFYKSHFRPIARTLHHKKEGGG